MIVIFANQKGGVGKTTLAMLFSNYLFYNGYPVKAVDIDLQKSLILQRECDIDNFEDQEVAYPIEYIQLDNFDQMDIEIGRLKSDIQNIYVIDVPGTIMDNSLIPVFIAADIVVCPFQYEFKCLSSTATFIKVLNKIKEKSPGMNPQIMFVPNKVDRRTGTKAEVEEWKNVDLKFQSLGTVTPRIFLKQSLQRANSLTINSEQIDEVKKCFEIVMKDIKSKYV